MTNNADITVNNDDSSNVLNNDYNARFTENKNLMNNNDDNNGSLSNDAMHDSHDVSMNAHADTINYAEPSVNKNGIITFEPDMPPIVKSDSTDNSENEADDYNAGIISENNDGSSSNISDEDVHVSPVVRAWVKTTVWFRMLPSRYKAWSSDDNPDRIDRDRMLSFALTPIMIGFMTQFFTFLVSYSALGLYMLFNHASYNDAIMPVENFFNSYLGIPVALLGMGLVMFSPIIRDMVKINGGYHISLRSDAFKKDMKTDSTMKAWLTLFIVGVFGGMVVWILHTIIINVLFNIGIDVTGSSSTTARVAGQESATDVGVLGWTGVMTAVNIVFSMIISPILEEFVFRGFVARCLIRSSFLTIKHGSRKGTRNWWRMLVICIISGLWFGAGHISTQDGLEKSVFLFVFMTLFAALLAWVSCVKFDSLWPAILIHVVYNGITLLVAFGIIGGGSDAGIMSAIFSQPL